MTTANCRAANATNREQLPTTEALRAAIFNLADQGVVKSRIAAALAMTESGVRYHLRRRSPEDRWLRDHDFSTIKRGDPPPRGVHSVIRLIWSEMLTQKITKREMARRVGISPDTLNVWFTGRSTPAIHLVEACLNVLSLTLTTEPKE